MVVLKNELKNDLMKYIKKTEEFKEKIIIYKKINKKYGFNELINEGHKIGGLFYSVYHIKTRICGTQGIIYITKKQTNEELYHELIKEQREELKKQC